MNCEHCDKKLEGQQKRFCSTDCWYASRKWKKIGSCEVCGSKFERKYKAQKCCSVACGNTAKRTDRTKECEHCGKVFERPHGIRIVDKVIDLLDSLTQDERRKVEKRIKELDK